MKYMIQFHHVPHELAMYKAELEEFGVIFYESTSAPNYMWIESDWEKDILESLMGVKTVYPQRFEGTAPLSPEFGRNWTEKLGTKWEDKPE